MQVPIRLSILIVLLLAFQAALAQTANNLAVDGTVKDEVGNKVVGASVHLYQDGALVNKVITGKNGRFDLFLDFDHEYIIEVGRAGYIKKRLYLNTKNVPKNEQLWGYEYGGFIVDLLKDVPGIDYSILDKPIGKVYYDPNVRNFVDDRVYTKEIRARLDQLQKDYERMLQNEKLMAAQLEKDYQVALRDAQAAMTDGDLLTAKENYLAASALRPNESLPKTKIAEIDKQLQARGQRDEQYQSLLASADQLFGSEKFQEAKAKYQEAAGIKPQETYPKSRIVDCDKRLAEIQAKADAQVQLAARDRQYREAIESGDKEFMAGRYANSKTHFQNALNHKPQDKYAMDQLVQVEIKLKEASQAAEALKRQAETDSRYAAQMDKAEAAFKASNFEGAKSMYEQALSIKPNEPYPKEQIIKIESVLADRRTTAEADEQRKKAHQNYIALIAEADRLFAAKNYPQARSRYSEAAAVKSEEPYPVKQIAEIERIEADIIAQRATESEKKADEERYKQLLARSDEALGRQQFEDARLGYNEAIATRPADPYPKQQLTKLAEAESRLAKLREAEAERAKLEEEYEETIRQADGHMSAENFAIARATYEKALSLKPSEKYPRDQMALAARRQKEKDEVEKQRLAQEKSAMEQARVDADYNEAIATADQYFGSKNYEAAAGGYRQASILKPAEQYPKDQLLVINRAEKAAKEDEARRMREREEQAELEQRKQRYEEQIKIADGLMSSEDFPKARQVYEQARNTKPDEQYPSDRIREIDARMAEMAQLQKSDQDNRQRYNNFLREGDLAVVSKRWEIARKAYQSALDIYPGEAIPAARLAEIDALERRHEEEKLQAEFNRLVASADKLFLERNLAEALKNYALAQTIRPGDGHVNERIQRIETQLGATASQQPEVAGVQRQIIEEEFDEGRTRVTVRKVVVGEKEETYKRVIHSWGGKYYFLNDRPITELVWEKETAK